MKSAGTFITNQTQKVLENKQYAIMLAVTFSVMPFASWLSVVLVALVTLRKGVKTGFEVLLPALVMHSVPLLMMVPVDTAVVNTCLAYVPCFIAALVLRRTQNWQWVFAVFLLLATLGSLLVQSLAPDLVTEQFSRFIALLAQYQEYQQLVIASNSAINSFFMAQLFFSVQILSVVISAYVSLLFARSLQSKLFVPGGFKKELLAFRCGKSALIPLFIIAIAAYYENPIGINLLPLILGYFLVSGFNLAFFLLARKRQASVFILLVLLILLKPFVVLALYILLGSLDSLFNFRVFLPTRMRESI